MVNPQQQQAQRTAGVLLHISSLPHGDLGEDAFRFVDFLHSIGASVWQTLPLNMTHGDGSPYQCLSAHAGNPAFISLQNLQAQGWLTKTDLAAKTPKLTVLAKAYQRFKKQADSLQHAQFQAFCHQHAYWLNDFALFLVLRNRFLQAGWNDWPEAYRARQVEALAQFSQENEEAIQTVKFIQFVFFEQWASLKKYANNKAVKLFGDVPIFVAYDSADVWAQPDMFKLDANGNMTVVAGVPPDYFSATGQRWGNPHYNWEAMQADGFGWWLDRMATQNDMFDIVRIDHFRGFEAAWEIPASEPTAMNGVWVIAPGDALLSAVKQRFSNMQLVAEDLGIITDEVNALRLKFDLPGMKILQFAFDGSENNPYLPKNITENSVVYTGTHDNDTTLGWYQSMSEEQRQPLHLFLNNAAPKMPDILIEMALESAAQMAIVPMQDILKLDSKHRMNTPGTIEGNWQWRFDWGQVQPEMVAQMQIWIAKSQRKYA